MKAKLYLTAALTAVLALAAACTADDLGHPEDIPQGNNPAPDASAVLTITVTDGAYAPATEATDANPATRAAEHGYATEFTAGDRIGLYVVKMDKGVHLTHKNLCLTYDGKAWTLPASVELTHESSDVYYYAYYPWQDGPADNMVNTAALAAGAMVLPEGFFDPLIRGWQPSRNQSTYAAYTASDLMVASGNLSPRTDGDGWELRFTMEHQMGLVVINIPATRCTYTETIDGVPVSKSYYLYNGTPTPNYWRENPGTARYLININSYPFNLPGSYYTPALEKKKYKVVANNSDFQPGKYHRYIIDGGETVTVERALAEGDFYMKDGSIVKGDATGASPAMPSDVQADCLGVVCWVGEKDYSGTMRHWTQTDWKQGDRLLMRDHPACTHGIVAALRDASDNALPWSSDSQTYLYDWGQSFSSFTQEEEADRDLIYDSNMNFGYCRSRLLSLFRDKTSARTEAYDAIGQYARSTSVPQDCSGWYFPGNYEIKAMCLGTLNLSDDQGMRGKLNVQFVKAGGKAFKEDIYWSLDDLESKAYSLDFSTRASGGYKPKTESHYVRAVLAF